AMHSRANGCEILLVNPVDMDGKAAFRLGEAADRRRLMALAMHEVSHIAESWHSERYASIFTDLVASVSEADADRGMRRAIADMRDAMKQSRTDLARYGHPRDRDLHVGIEHVEHVGDEPVF